MCMSYFCYLVGCYFCVSCHFVRGRWFLQTSIFLPTLHYFQLNSQTLCKPSFVLNAKTICDIVKTVLRLQKQIKKIVKLFFCTSLRFFFPKTNLQFMYCLFHHTDLKVYNFLPKLSLIYYLCAAHSEGRQSWNAGWPPRISMWEVAAVSVSISMIPANPRIHRAVTDIELPLESENRKTIYCQFKWSLRKWHEIWTNVWAVLLCIRFLFLFLFSL